MTKEISMETALEMFSSGLYKAGFYLPADDRECRDSAVVWTGEDEVFATADRWPALSLAGRGYESFLRAVKAIVERRLESRAAGAACPIDRHTLWGRSRQAPGPARA